MKKKFIILAFCLLVLNFNLLANSGVKVDAPETPFVKLEMGQSFAGGTIFFVRNQGWVLGAAHSTYRSILIKKLWDSDDAIIVRTALLGNRPLTLAEKKTQAELNQKVLYHPNEIEIEIDGDPHTVHPTAIFIHPDHLNRLWVEKPVANFNDIALMKLADYREDRPYAAFDGKDKRLVGLVELFGRGEMVPENESAVVAPAEKIFTDFDGDGFLNTDDVCPFSDAQSLAQVEMGGDKIGCAPKDRRWGKGLALRSGLSKVVRRLPKQGGLVVQEVVSDIGEVLTGGVIAGDGDSGSALTRALEDGRRPVVGVYKGPRVRFYPEKKRWVFEGFYTDLYSEPNLAFLRDVAGIGEK